MVDPPVVALASPAVITGPPEEGLWPKDKRLEHSLTKAHQAAAWAIKASSAASFFNRATLMWIKQLQNCLPVSDTRTHQDVNKIVAALEYSADTTLNASRFAGKAIGSNIISRRLLWLCHWQADAKNKWQLASSPYSGDRLFGAPLESLLIESKDKRKILPSLSRRGEVHPSSFFRPFRGSTSCFSGSRAQRYFSPSQDRQERQSGFVQ